VDRHSPCTAFVNAPPRHSVLMAVPGLIRAAVGVCSLKGKPMRKMLVAGLGLALLIAAGAIAQERERVRETTTVKVRKITAIMGSEVRLRAAALGKVTDIVINENGCVDFLIVRDEEEYVAVPWGVVRYEAGERTITVTTEVTREKLRSLRFRSAEWPDFYSEKWRRSAGEVWGEKALRRHDDTRRDDIRRDDKRKDDRRDDDKRKDLDKRKDDKRDDDKRKDLDKRKDDKRDDDKRKDLDKRKDDKRKDLDKRKDDKRDDDKRKDDKRKDKEKPPPPDKDKSGRS
jgi:hypothetical protein